VSKSLNPKDTVAAGKVPFHLWPDIATALGSLALLDGALKYGRMNWRTEPGPYASTNVDAVRRHLAAWMEGEEADPDSGLPHLAHALACLALLADAQAAGTLQDDRHITTGRYRAAIDQLTRFVEPLRERHKDKSPKHYTIGDTLPHNPLDDLR
jgi:hypothetical protein